MSRRTVAVGVSAVAVFVVVDTLLAWASGWPLLNEWMFGFVSTATFAVLGGLITWKRPVNRLGWLLLAMTVLSAAASAAFRYGIAGTTRWPSLPAADVVGGVGFGVQALGFGVLITFFLLLFPDGHLPSHRWVPVAWVAGLGIALMIVGLSVSAADAGMGEVVASISGGEGFGGQDAGRLVNNTGHVLVFSVFPLAVVSLFVRRRRAGPVERRQLKWFAYGAVLFLASVLIPWPEPLWFILEAAATIFLPISVAIAITRYRLYEIDRIVSRTVSYGAVTAVLVGVYVLLAVVPSTVFRLESDLLVAGATLAAAAAFVPVRRWVQALVDRRFNRARYDAAAVIERFGTRLRRELDLDSLASDVRGVVATTVQPTHVSVWLCRDGPAE